MSSPTRTISPPAALVVAAMARALEDQSLGQTAYDEPEQDSPATEPAETDTLTVSISRPGEDTYVTETDVLAAVMKDEDGNPVMRLLGREEDIGVAVSLILYGVGTQFGIDALPEFIERSVGLAQDLLFEEIVTGRGPFD